MNRAKIRIIATNIMLCEKELQQGKNVEFNKNKIEKYMSMLSTEDAFWLMDEYIMKNYGKY